MVQVVQMDWLITLATVLRALKVYSVRFVSVYGYCSNGEAIHIQFVDVWYQTLLHAKWATFTLLNSPHCKTDIHLYILHALTR